MKVLPVLLAVVAALLWTRPRVGVTSSTGRWPKRRRAGLVGAGALGGSLAAMLDGRDLILAGLLAATVAAGSVLVARSRLRSAAALRAGRVLEACEALAGELRAGQPPPAALERTARLWPELAPAAAACRLDADVPAAFRRLARQPGASGLHELAAAWQVALEVGAALAPTLDRVVDTARGRLATRRIVATELASAQATARVVTVLPVVVLAVSDGAGGDPWGFLLDTTPGLACLAAGLGLCLAGLGWIDRIVERVHVHEP